MNNTILDLLEIRPATRAIDTSPLDDGTVDYLKEVARFAPSCFNKQPWRFLFLLSREALDKAPQFLAPANNKWASRAPLIIIGYSRKEDDCVLDDGRAYHEFDLGMSVMNIMLAATERNLVARPMAGFNPAKVKELFNLDEKDMPMIALAVGGRSADESFLPDYFKEVSNRPRKRKSAGEIIRVF